MADMRGIQYGLLGMAAGVFLFVKGFLWLKQKNFIQNIPTSKIRSLAMGLVEIYGQVIPQKEKIVKSPFTEKDCVYYKYTIEEYRSSGKSSHWVTIRSGTHNEYFFLQDSTGNVLVDPKGAKIDIKRSFECMLNKNTPPGVTKYLDDYKIKYKALFGNYKTMRFREYLIEPKNKLYIIGTAADNPFVEDASVQEGVKDIMIQRGRNDKMYFISDKQEKDLIKRFKWKIIGGLLGGGILIVISLAMILFMFGIF